MRISIIAAVSANGVIGQNNKLPWHIPEDLKYFKNKTLHNPIIMGRKTFESLPGILPNRDHFIITKNTNYKIDSKKCYTNNSLFAVLKTLKNVTLPVRAGLVNEAFVVGGQQLFELSLDLKMIDHMYITYIDKFFDGDVFFPTIPSSYKLVSNIEGKESSDGLRYYFREYSRK